MIQVDNHADLLKHLKGSERAFVLIYKSQDSEQSTCAYNSLLEIDKASIDHKFMGVNVSMVKDIHSNYGVTSVPTLLEFNNGELKNIIKGCHDSNYYKNIFEGNTFTVEQTKDNKKPQKSVTVYSTPSCSWCTTLKNYLKDHNIKFRDIDVSRDVKAAEDMVKRSGQQGVPQTSINGSVIIGFDKNRIDKLLGIQSK